MSDLSQADGGYLRALKGVPLALEQALATVGQLGPLPIDDGDVTRAILVRLKTYYDAQKATKQLLGKVYASAAADFFVETVLFFMQALIKTYDLDLRISSEERLLPRRKAMRPDIVVRRGSEVVAMIECKTQLGWNRTQWEADFLQREQRLHGDFPDAEAFLVVATQVNWQGFEGHPLAGNKYFALCKTWPSDVDPDHPDGQIGDRIEPLFRRLVERARNGKPGSH